MWNSILKTIAIFSAISLAACANNPLRSYKAESDKSLATLKMGNLEMAESSLNANGDVLYYLEHGSLARMNQNYPQSESDFFAANSYVDAWVASYHNGVWGSISDTSEAVLINDNVVDYQMRDYEKVMLNTYLALNALSMGDWDSARVQIQRMYQLEQLIQNYREAEYQKMQSDSKSLPKNATSYQQFIQKNQSDNDFVAISSPQVLALKNSYQNAFSHYLAGFVFEALGEDSLARPGYIKALQLNPTNSMISRSVANIDKGNKPGNSYTDLLLVEEVGHAPQLKSHTINIPFTSTINNKNCINNISISFPSLVIDKENQVANTFEVDGTSYNPILFTDVNLMAARYLKDDLPNIFIRNMLRAARDGASQQAACNSGSGIINLAVIGSELILNRADERAWVLLPGQIYVNRVRLKRGMHTLTVNTAVGLKTIKVNLNSPYQVVTWRVIGNQVYFSPAVASPTN